MNDGQNNSYIRKRIFFYLGFLLIILLALIMIRPFFMVIIMSLISVVLLKPLYNFFLGLGWAKERTRISVTLTLSSFLLIIVVPIYLIVRLAVAQISEAFVGFGSQDVEALLQFIQGTFRGIRSSGAAIEGAGQFVETVQGLVISIGLGLAQWLVDLASSIPGLVIQLVIFIAIVASLLPVFDDMIEFSQRVSPIGYELEEICNRKITAMVKSLAILGVPIWFVAGELGRRSQFLAEEYVR